MNSSEGSKGDARHEGHEHLVTWCVRKQRKRVTGRGVHGKVKFHINKNHIAGN